MALLIGALFAMRMPCGAATPVLTTLYSFPDAAGAFPEAGLVLSNGVLVGTTYSGGSSGWGTVFALSPPSASGGAWSIHELYVFTGGADGANPRAGMIVNSQGVLFGTTEQGGASDYGVVFSLIPAGGGKYTEKVVYSFTGQGNDGAYPEAGLTLGPKSGYLYGTTYGGGTAGYGTVFAMTPAVGGTWTPRVRHYRQPGLRRRESLRRADAEQQRSALWYDLRRRGCWLGHGVRVDAGGRSLDGEDTLQL